MKSRANEITVDAKVQHRVSRLCDRRMTLIPSPFYCIGCRYSCGVFSRVRNGKKRILPRYSVSCIFTNCPNSWFVD